MLQVPLADSPSLVFMLNRWFPCLNQKEKPPSLRKYGQFIATKTHFILRSHCTTLVLGRKFGCRMVMLFPLGEYIPHSWSRFRQTYEHGL